MHTAVLLQEHQIRPSAQRLIVFNYLKSVKTHPSVDTIYQALVQENPGLSRTTVYNTLELLSKKGLIQTLDFGEGFLRYDADITPHCHFICHRCNTVFDIFQAPPDCKDILPEGFQLRHAALYMHGFCANCSQQD